MEIPTPPQAVAALAAFVRDRLAEVSGTFAPSARQLATVIVGAAAPFAPTSYSRARLIRQMHASGLLTDEHLVRAQQVLELEPDPRHHPHNDANGAPR